MDLENRISLLIELGEYMQSDNEEWRSVKTAAFQQNAWFIPEFIDLAVSGIVRQFLQPDLLRAWVKEYDFPSVTAGPKNIGLVTAGLCIHWDEYSTFGRQIRRRCSRPDRLPHTIGLLHQCTRC